MIYLWIYTAIVTLLSVFECYREWKRKGYLAGDSLFIVVLSMIPVVNVIIGFVFTAAFISVYFNEDKRYFQRKTK